MRMRRFLTVLAIAFSVLAQSALAEESNTSVLLWMLDDPDILCVDGSTTIKTADLGDLPGAAGEANAVRLRVIDSDSGAVAPIYLSFWDDGYDPDDTLIGIPDDWNQNKAGPVYSQVGQYADSTRFSFMIEIGYWDEDGETWSVLAASQMATYNELNTAGHIFPNEIAPAEHLAWTGGQYSVPEPSSGLLLLIGGALLGLRRRRP